VRPLNEVLNLFPGTVQEDWTQHINYSVTGAETGGWVHKDAIVSPTAWIDPGAIVAESAQVKDRAKVLDSAIISGQAVLDKNAVASGNAVVRDTTYLTDSATVSDRAVISGSAILSKEASVSQDSVVSGQAFVTDKAQIRGQARVGGEVKIFHRAQVDEWAKLDDRAMLCDDAKVFGSATLTGTAIVQDSARVLGNSNLTEVAVLSGNSQVLDNAASADTLLLSGDAAVVGHTSVTATTIGVDDAKIDQRSVQTPKIFSGTPVESTHTTVAMTPLPERPLTTPLSPPTVFGRFVTRLLGNGVDQTYEVVHNLNTINLFVTVYDENNVLIYPDVELKNLNVLRVTVQEPLAFNSGRIMIWSPDSILSIPYDGGYQKISHQLKTTALLIDTFQNYWPFYKVYSDLRIVDPNAIELNSEEGHYRLNILPSYKALSEDYDSETFQIGDGSTTIFNVHHSLNTFNIFVGLYDQVPDGIETYSEVSLIDSYHVRIEFNVPPSASQYILVLFTPKLV
jgi:UDP-3-O-[3-hydroxymyristoyl] glucosamine N-acyltransferase